MSALTSVAHLGSQTLVPRQSLKGKRVGMVLFSTYPADPRPRRAVEALLNEGMSMDLICLQDGSSPSRESQDHFNIVRVPLTHRRGNKLSYLYKYSAFIALSAAILAGRSVRQRYDLIYVHNMPDVLVVSALLPKLLGAKVILDQHDPMPELMMAIFNRQKTSRSVRLLTWLEKWSIRRADRVITVNIACKRIFSSRSCSKEKVGVVMNSPAEEIFPFRPVGSCPRPGRSASKQFVLMYHGSLVERNGLDLAVDALERVRRTIPSAQLRIYGRKTEFLERVMTGVLQKGLQTRVHYLGPKTLKELVDEIDSCDLGIVPNPRNAFTEINTPTRIFEYLALGKPVIAPDTAGIQDYFDTESLIFFESGNCEDLARTIEQVYSNYPTALKTAEQGQRVYLAHSWSQEREKLVGLVSDLLQERKLR